MNYNEFRQLYLGWGIPKMTFIYEGIYYTLLVNYNNPNYYNLNSRSLSKEAFINKPLFHNKPLKDIFNDIHIISMLDMDVENYIALAYSTGADIYDYIESVNEDFNAFKELLLKKEKEGTLILLKGSSALKDMAQGTEVLDYYVLVPSMYDYVIIRIYKNDQGQIIIDKDNKNDFKEIRHIKGLAYGSFDHHFKDQEGLSYRYYAYKENKNYNLIYIGYLIGVGLCVAGLNNLKIYPLWISGIIVFLISTLLLLLYLPKRTKKIRAFQESLFKQEQYVCPYYEDAKNLDITLFQNKLDEKFHFETCSGIKQDKEEIDIVYSSSKQRLFLYFNSDIMKVVYENINDHSLVYERDYSYRDYNQLNDLCLDVIKDLNKITLK